MLSLIPSHSVHKTALLLLLFSLFVTESSCETIVDNCGAVHGAENSIGSVRVSSDNLIVDTDNAENYDGDRGRFKRDNASPGVLSYVSELGFERIVINGYVFGMLPRGSWSLNVTVGDAESSESSESILLLRRSNVRDYMVEGGAQDWERFRVEMRMRRCPSRVELVLDGPATNNEYPGWGLQLSRVQLVQSWFANCTASCRFNRSECAALPARQVVDAAESFRDAYSTTSNIDLDSSNPVQYFGGDTSRYMRSNNRKGEIVYAATEGIQTVDVEVYQYRPYDTQINVIPYNSENCQPIILEPAFSQMPEGDVDGWIHRTARFDLRSLPLCPTHVAVRISGGANGWELEISRVTLSIMGELEVNPAVNLRTESESSDDGGSSGIEWWIWLCGLVGVIVVCLVAAIIVQKAALCCGKDERSIYHFSRLRTLLGRRRNSSDEDIPDTHSRPPVNTTEPSFTFAPVRISSP